MSRYKALRDDHVGAEIRSVTLKAATRTHANWVPVGGNVIHGPSRLLAVPRLNPMAGHTHEARLWPDGTPALAILINGDLDDAWLIPFEQGGT